MKISLKALRVNANLSQNDAAKQLGINKATLINWEKNKTFPNVVQVDRMCKLYKCKLDDIFLPDTLTQS